jgi:hypothetical protein
VLSGGRKTTLKKAVQEAEKEVRAQAPKVAKFQPFHQPFLVEPKAGAVLEVLGKGIFTWERVAMADQFEVQISQDPSFKQLALGNRLNDNFLLFRPQTAGTYHWRVRSIKGKKESPWSNPRVFTVR